MSERTQMVALAKPFPDRFVEKAPSGFGSYVGHDIVTQRLLFVLGPFDFTINEVVRSPEGIIEGCLATLTVKVDGESISVMEAGDCDNPATKKTQGDRLKNASSDAIKRCAMRLGLGLHLWSGDNYFLYKQLTVSHEDTLDQERPFV